MHFYCAMHMQCTYLAGYLLCPAVTSQCSIETRYFFDLSYTVLQGDSGRPISKTKRTFIWNFVPTCELCKLITLSVHVSLQHCDAWCMACHCSSVTADSPRLVKHG